jgi:hypothetical protein
MYCIKYMSGKDGQTPPPLPPKLYSIYHWGSRSVKLQIQYMAPHVQTFALLQEVGRTENFPKNTVITVGLQSLFYFLYTRSTNKLITSRIRKIFKI